MAQVKEHPTRGYVYQLDDKEQAKIREFVTELIANKGPDNDGLPRNEFSRKYMGYMGEYAAAIHYGVDHELVITPGVGDGNIDFWAGGAPVAVQSSSRQWDTVAVERKKVECSTPAREFVFCAVNTIQARVHVYGVMTLERVKQFPTGRLKPGGLDNYLVDASQLAPPIPPVREPVYFEGPEVYPPPMNLTFEDRKRFYHGDWRNTPPEGFEVKEGEIWNNIKAERERQEKLREQPSQ